MFVYKLLIFALGVDVQVDGKMSALRARPTASQENSYILELELVAYLKREEEEKKR